MEILYLIHVRLNSARHCTDLQKQVRRWTSILNSKMLVNIEDGSGSYKVEHWDLSIGESEISLTTQHNRHLI